MADNEIIKALECCSDSAANCKDCPYSENGDVCNSIDIFKDTLNLINRLQADKEALIAGQESLQKYIAKLKAEIERLKEDCNRWELLYKLALREKEVAYEGCRNMLKRAKSEAIKEFAEVLKEQAEEFDMADGGVETLITIDRIDNLVEEVG